MSKISNILIMLKMLQGGKIYKIKELADILEVSPRQIRTYKNELEKAGIYIDSISGPYGGYIYNATNEISEISFDISELNGLEQLQMYLYEKNDSGEYIPNLNVVVEKLRYLLLYSKNEKSHISNDMKNSFYNIISKSIIDNNLLLIEYFKGKTTTKKRKVIPQNIYKNDGEFYVTGFCPEIKDIRTFAFSNIKSIKTI